MKCSLPSVALRVLCARFLATTVSSISAINQSHVMDPKIRITNPIDPALPPPLSAVFEGSYAYKTVQTRMPVALTKVVDHLSRYKSEVCEEKRSNGSQGARTHDAPLDTASAHRQEVEEELKQILGSLAKLRNELQTNKAITLFPEIASDDEMTRDQLWGVEDLAEWNAVHESLFAKNLLNNTDSPKWFESAWLYVEPYMYRRIIWAVQETKHLRHLDPFKWQKAESVEENKENIKSILDYLNDTLATVDTSGDKFSQNTKTHFKNLLRLSLWGNKGDLSHSAGKEKKEEEKKTEKQDPHKEQKKMAEILVADESDAIWNHLVEMNKQSSGPVRVDVICDNYGFELITDLVFGEFLLATKLASQVQYHVKKLPWFVSDTTIPDFHRALDLVNDHVSKFGDKWRKYLDNGKFALNTDPFWSLPYDFDWMERKAPGLYEKLKMSSLLILKGDLNYRKATGDLEWPHTVPLRTALRSFAPAPLCMLRGLKAEVVVGLKEGVAEEMGRKHEDWMTSGEFAVIQFYGHSKLG